MTSPTAALLPHQVLTLRSRWLAEALPLADEAIAELSAIPNPTATERDFLEREDSLARRVRYYLFQLNPGLQPLDEQRMRREIIAEAERLTADMTAYLARK